jgi:hypothetical protein
MAGAIGEAFRSDRRTSVFICYAHEDNESSNPKKERWLERLLDHLIPLERQTGLDAWSDRRILAGEPWQERIRQRLAGAEVAVLLISPAFLKSDYIARSELPVLLKDNAERGLKILPVIVSPCVYDLAKFKFPDWQSGPYELLLSDLQSINPPSRALSQMTDAEQESVLVEVAKRIHSCLEEGRLRAKQEEEEEKEQERSKHLKDALDSIERGYSDGDTKHSFSGGTCIVCGLSAHALARSRWFDCNRVLRNNSLAPARRVIPQS